MFFIPGIIIAIITFPGVIVHELSHQIFCFIRRVPVYEVKYFQFNNPTGYVLHEPSSSPLTNFIISIGPFIINSLLGAIILFPASIEMSEFGLFNAIYNENINANGVLKLLPILILYWLGISIMMHAFPSTGDAQNLVSSILKNKEINIFIKILVAPFVGLIYLGAIGSVVWLDLGYAILISFSLPKLLTLFL